MAGAVWASNATLEGDPSVAPVQARHALGQPLTVVRMPQHWILQQFCGCGTLICILVQAGCHDVIQRLRTHSYHYHSFAFARYQGI